MTEMLTGSAHAVAGGRYRIVRFLGQGASKQVFLAHDTERDRDVAIAFVHRAATSPETLARVRREVKAAARLGDHPNVVAVYDVGEEDGRTYVVSQYVEGGSVAERLRRLPGRRLPVDEAVAIAAQIAAALDHAHAHAVVHRDVKPGNVFVTGQGTALLGDFGIAVESADLRVTAELAFAGTAHYMAPEQARGHAGDGRSDLYSLGATLFELVCGRPPFTGEDPIAVVAQHAHSPRPRAGEFEPSVPPELDALIAQLLAIAPADRPAAAAAVHERLAALTPGGARAVPARALAEPVRLPPALASGRQRSFVGRAAPLGMLRETWIRATTGQPGVVFLAGNAGIGKTRLCAQLAQEVQDAGATVLYGRCEEEALAPYGPLVQSLRHYATYGDVLALPAAAELARLGWPIPGRDQTPPQEQPTERYELFEAAVALVRELAERAPLLVILDDLHWADLPTLRVLRHQIRHVADAPVMLLCTMRNDEPRPDQRRERALAEMRREPIVEMLTLAGLTEEETAALVAARARATAEPDVVSQLWRRTEGNPFYIEETLRTAGGLAQLQEDLAEAGGVGRTVPTGIDALIERRLAALQPATREALDAAAIIGREFGLALLAAVLDRPLPEVTDALEEAIRDGLVVELPGHVDRFAFGHALVRVTLYRRQPASARMRLHARCAEALEARHAASAPHAAELAHHFFEARHATGGDKALQYSLAAAKWAASALAYEEAVTHQMHAQQVLAEQGRDAERCALLLSCGRMLWRAGETDDARRTFDEAAALARELDDPERFAQAALGFGRRYYDPGEVDAPQIALLEEALERLPEDDSGLRARVLSGLADALQFRDPPERVQALSREAVAMARRVGDPYTLGMVLAGLHNALLHIAHLDERLAVGAEMLALARESRRDEHVATALHWRLYDLFELGDLEAARREHAVLVDLAERLRQPLYQHFAAAWTAKWAETAGRFAEAEELARRSLRYAERAHMPYAHSNYAGQLFGLRRDRGELGKLPEEVREHIGERPRLPVWRAGMIGARLDAGQHERARADFEELARDDFAGIPADLFWLGATCLLAEACGRLGDRARAEILYRQLEPYADRNAQVGLAVSIGVVHRFLGRLAAVLERWDVAERHFEAALARSAAMEAITSLANARFEYAEMLLARRGPGDRERAAEHLTAARTTAEELGMLPVARRAALLQGAL